MKAIENCTLCPRRCGVDRRTEDGVCAGGESVLVSQASPHFGEEGCLSGTRGSGTVFFGGCGLGCLFCQNYAISHRPSGREKTPAQLARLFLQLQEQGVHNLNLVTPTHYRPWLKKAIREAKENGLTVPVVWNTSGYEHADAVDDLRDDVDIWLTDLKFYDVDLAKRLADAPDYFEHASAFIKAAQRHTGNPAFTRRGLLQRGVLVRLLVLPGESGDAVQLLEWLAEAVPTDGVIVNVMSQYHPVGTGLPAPLDRPLVHSEYRRVVQAAQRLGFKQLLTQRY